MEPRDLARLGIMVSLGGLGLAFAAWLLGIGLRGGGPFAPLVLLGGLAVLLLAVIFLGGAGLDAVWARLERVRGAGRKP